MFKIDEHVGIAIAGLTSDARVLRFLSFSFLSVFLSFLLVDVLCDFSAATS